ncbi:DEKNAAC100053 [Brettanomyces naardenensis]|uniref:DEKNAAC100053 n=1 Tax=Brettanomyces naardenensis TaxID=13370 RepID=A0A448YG95_BRENA|nr:DEKNAAC100053 [Brettanomyces naardenensis]
MTLEPSNILLSKSFLVLEYFLSEYSSRTEIEDALSKIVPLAYSSQTPTDFTITCQLPQVLELALVCIPNNVSLQEILEVVSSFLAECLAYSQTPNTDRSFEALFEELPPIISQAISLQDEEVINSAKRAVDYIDAQASRFGYPIDSRTSVPWEKKALRSMFFSFCRSRILKHNDTNPGESVVPVLRKISGSPFWSEPLYEWIHGFYMPLVHLSRFIEIPPLSDFDSYLSTSEQIELILGTAIEKNAFTAVISDTLIPYLEHQPGLWNEFNQWLVRFGDKTINEPDTKKMATNYTVLLDLVRQDNLLRAISKNREVLDDFISILISTIYLCPKAILEVFVSAKEIIGSLRVFKLDQGVEGDALPSPQETVEKMYQLIRPTSAFLKSCEKAIETGQRLYGNELSLIEIVNLSTSDSSTQLSELQKFIDSESRYGKNSRQWETLLSSIYWIFNNTEIFNQVDSETLDEMIFTKLLDLKFFNIISNVFLAEFCQLPEDKSHSIIMKYAWMYYKRATNCNPDIGSLKFSLACVNLIGNETPDVAQLRNLIYANKALMNWKLSFKPGVPVTPKQILEIDEPYKVIYRILELNEGSYRNPDALFRLLKMLIMGLNCYDKRDIFKYADESDVGPEELNPMLADVKLTCLDFASTDDTDYAYNLSVELLGLAVDHKRKESPLFRVISDKWFSFFQFVKNEIEGSPSIEMIDRKLRILGELILVTPAEFNIPVLEQWQLMNAQKGQLSNEAKGDQNSAAHTSTNTPEIPGTYNFFESSGLGDLRSRLQTSLKTSASDILNSADSADIGRNIIGRIVGAK